MKKIGIFCGYYIPHLGGVERYVDKLSASLMRLGYEVVIVTSNHAGLPDYEVLEGRHVYRLPILGFAKERYPIPRVDATYKSLIGRIEDEKIDYFLLNTRFHLTSLIGAKMGKRLGRPTMLIEHGTDHFTVNNRYLDYFGKLYEHLLTRLVKRYVDRFYGVSKKCNVWLKHFGIHASGVFYNSIDPADKKKVKDYYKKTYTPNEVAITYAGRLIREKGILNLLDAFIQVKQENSKRKLKLVVAGDGDLLEYIRQTYTDPSIVAVGRLDFSHVMALYKHTDIFVYPSLYPEGLPTSILEAGLMDCAVIATPRGGTEEVIIDERHGIITDGSVEGLRESISRLVRSPSARQRMARTLESRVIDQFSWDVVAKAVDKEINSFNVTK